MKRARYDSSTVFHKNDLCNVDCGDNQPEVKFPKGRPWCFETPDSVPQWQFFTSEEEAEQAQRQYRAANGFDEVTGVAA